ncbi:hypothetical protein WJX81_001034 [Elliptochloris bilobata]|uniref:Uncharacterized protein n=1 Tax=Elliptochloris bilobata TaxID=381761 RepID=A0AAW1SK96_9CHLO
MRDFEDCHNWMHAPRRHSHTAAVQAAPGRKRGTKESTDSPAGAAQPDNAVCTPEGTGRRSAASAKEDSEALGGARTPADSGQSATLTTKPEADASPISDLHGNARKKKRARSASGLRVAGRSAGATALHVPGDLAEDRIQERRSRGFAGLRTDGGSRGGDPREDLLPILGVGAGMPPPQISALPAAAALARECSLHGCLPTPLPTPRSPSAPGQPAGLLTMTWLAVGRERPPPARPRSADPAGPPNPGPQAGRSRASRSARQARADAHWEPGCLGSALTAGLRKLQALDACE